jgi:hypothetical protein
MEILDWRQQENPGQYRVFREIMLGVILQAVGLQDCPVPTQRLNLAQN